MDWIELNSFYYKLLHNLLNCRKGQLRKIFKINHFSITRRRGDDVFFYLYEFMQVISKGENVVKKGQL